MPPRYTTAFHNYKQYNIDILDKTDYKKGKNALAPCPPPKIGYGKLEVEDQQGVVNSGS